MNIKYDFFGLPEPSTIYLCRPDNSLVCELNGIDFTTVSYIRVFNNCDTLQFNVYKYVDGELSTGYDLLDEAMYLRVDNIGYFRMQRPQVEGDGYTEYKSISAESCDCELLKKLLVGFNVNMGSEDSLEIIADGNVAETDEGVKIPREYVRLYYPEKPQLSLLHNVLKKVPGWSVGRVDPSLDIAEIEDSVINDDGTVTVTKKTDIVKRSFEIDSQTIYSFLTQDIETKYECIVLFDILNRQVNVVDVKNFGVNSEVFISYRNLLQKTTINVQSEDSVFTRFNVRGADDLTIDYVNYGTSYIEDLSYFLKQQYMSKILIAKYQKWLDAINSNRATYMAYGKQFAVLMEKRDEIDMRVPNDGLDTSWKQFSDKELEETILPKYRGYKKELEDLYLNKDDNTWSNRGAYQDWLCYGDGDIYSDTPERTGIIGSIVNTIRYKRTLPPYDKEKDNQIDEDLDAWKTQWDLYGLTELNNKLKAYEQNIEALSEYQKAWSELSSDEKQKHLSEVNYNISHKKYQHFLDLKNKCTEARDQRKSEYDAAQTEMKKVSAKMKELKDNVYDKENFKINFSDEELEQLSKYPHKDNYDFSKFTSDDLITLSKLYTDSDYQNENIVDISTNTAAQTITTQYDLWKDAKEQLTQESQPQLSFSISMDNFYAIPEFQNWCGVFDIGNFIWLSTDDDDEEIFTKLRISQITWNPCVIDSNFEVQFTNMIIKNGNRNDFSVILDSAIKSSQSQISSKISKTLDTTAISLPDSLIQALVNSRFLNNAITNGVYDTISANTGTFGEVISKIVNGKTILGESGLFETINVDATTSKTVLALDINANRISVGTLAVDRLIIRGSENSIMYEFNKTLGGIVNKEISDDELNQYYLNGKNIQAHTISADEILSHTITSTEITTSNIKGINGWINLHNGTFAYYSRPDKSKSIEDLQNELINTYKEKTDDQSKKLVELLTFQIDSMNPDQISTKINSLNDFNTHLDNTTENEELKTKLNNLIKYMTNFMYSLLVNDKIADEKQLSAMTDSVLATEFGVDITDPNFQIIKSLVASANVSEAGLLSWNGSKLLVRGTIDAIDGHIGGMVISNNAIYTDGHNSWDAKNDGVFINSDKIALGNNGIIAFDKDGTGKIGPWNICKSSIWKGNSTWGTENSTDSKNAYFGDSGLSISNKFTVNADGDLNANNVTLSGIIKAGSGSTLGPWSITDDAICKNNSSFGEQGYGNAYFGKDGLSITDKFMIDRDGTANISGTINASGGSLGAWKFTNDYIYNGIGFDTAGSTNSCGMSANSKGPNGSTFWAGNGAFSVDANGKIIAGNGQFSVDTDGTINTYGGIMLTTYTSDGKDKAAQISYKINGPVGESGVILNNGISSVCHSSYTFRPSEDNKLYLGNSNYKWKNIHASSGTIQTSDKNLKTNIHNYSSNLEEAYMEFEPVSFKYKNFKDTDTHDRTHYGFIAQQIEESLKNHGINAENAGFLCIDNRDTPNGAGEYKEYSLRYSEFISLNTYMIQKLYKRIEELEKKLSNNS